MPRFIMTNDGMLGIPSDDEESGDEITAVEDYELFFSYIKTEGLSPDRIEKFTTFNADQNTLDEGCTICISDVEINKLMIRLDCNHVFCRECIIKWFEKKVTCPMCRKVYSN